MNKVITRLFLIVVLMFFIPKIIYAHEYYYTNPNTGFDLVIEDDASLLSENQIDKLISDMMPLTSFGNIAFKSISANSTSTDSYASSYYHNKFGTKSGSVFLIDMKNRIIYIFSDGNNYNTITNNKAEIITDNVYRFATNKDYYTCASKAFSQMNSLLSGGKIAEPMRIISNIIISVIIAFFINFFFIAINSRVKSAKAKEILKNCDISFQVSNIIGVMTGQHREYSPQGDGGGSSSGGGGGGGSSGGGGGHSF